MFVSLFTMKAFHQADKLNGFKCPMNQTTEHLTDYFNLINYGRQ